MDPQEIARKFVELGYHVFPLYKGSNNQKMKPFGWAKNEVLDPEKIDKAIPATNDANVVDSWPELVKKKYNSTVVGFGVLGIDCVIVDVDVKNDKPGIQEFQQMLTDFKVPNPTMVTITKSGGLHAYYKRPPNLREAYVKTIAGVTIKSKRFSAIDLRGNGGFVVGPEKLVDDLKDRQSGQYVLKGLSLIQDLPEFPGEILSGWLRTMTSEDVDSLISSAFSEDDYKAKIRRGLIPDFVPKGSRNESFFLLANVLKGKGVPKEVARQMCKILAEKVEEPETLAESVNVEDILDRAYVVRKDSPYDIAVDLINYGLFQMTGYKSKLHYIILEENPYIASKSPHDEVSMKILLAKFQKAMLMDSGKTKTINPMDVVTKIIHDENRVDTVGFKPNAGQVFCMHDDPGSKRFLNTYRHVIISKDPHCMDEKVWNEFVFLVTRLFGNKENIEHTLGLDFVAWMIQFPHIKPSIAPFIMSHKRGVGKSLFFNLIIQVLGMSKDGERQGRLTKLDEIAGRFFNPAGCILNLIDEVQFPLHRDTRKESVTFWRHMKNLITAETISVEIKGGATYQVPNSAALILAGNSGGNFPVEEFDRRLWIIDNNPEMLKRGEVDLLFNIVKGIGIGADDRQKLINTLRHHLNEHKITIELDSILAPMTDLKKEMYLNSLTDMEEWFLSYFDNKDHMFAETPVISKSAFNYLIDAIDPLKSYKWSEDLEGLFRDFKRRGYLRPIRMKANAYQSRQFTVPTVGSDGKLYQTEKREILYTTREHGSFDLSDSKDVIHAYMQNTQTIKYFQGQIKKNVAKTLTGGELDER